METAFTAGDTVPNELNSSRRNLTIHPIFELHDICRTDRVCSAAELNRVNINHIVVGHRDEKRFEETLLFAASETGNFIMVNLLLSLNADPNICDGINGRSCLMVAIESGYFQIASLLIQHHANVNYQDKEGAGALHSAVLNERYDLVDLLMNHGADVNGPPGSESPLLLACQIGDLVMMNQLLNYGADPHFIGPSGWTAVAAAAFANSVPIVMTLIASNVDLNADQTCPALYCAVQNGNHPLVQILLAAGASVLLKYNGDTMMHAAARNNDSLLVLLLYEKKATFDERNPDGETPLYVASQGGFVQIVRTLVDWGANVNSPNNTRRTPLHAASFGGHLSVIKVLADSGAHINAQMDGGATPLLLAAQTGEYDSCEVLLKSGANANIVTDENQTALFVAGFYNRSKIVNLLIEYGGCSDSVDCHGLTAMNWAYNAGNEEVATLMQSSKRALDSPPDLRRTMRAKGVLCPSCSYREVNVTYDGCSHSICDNCYHQFYVSTGRCPVCDGSVKDGS